VHGDGSKIEEKRRGLAGLFRQPTDGACGELAHGLRVVALGRIEADFAGGGRELGGTQAEDVVIFHKHAALVVVILRHGELVVEAEFERTWLQFLGKIEARLRAVAEVPLADKARCVTVFLQERGDGGAGGFDEERVEGVGDAAVIERGAPAIATGDEGVTRRRADGGRRIGGGEAAAFAREAIKIWGADERGVGTVGPEAAVAVVVGEDDDDVGRGRRGGAGDGEEGGGEQSEDSDHGRVIARNLLLPAGS